MRDTIRLFAAATLTAALSSGSFAALIGVDFGGNGIGGVNAPTNWNAAPAGSVSINTPIFVNNLIDETGATTGINLRIDADFGSNISNQFYLPFASQLPTHTQSLAGIDGLSADLEGIHLSLSNLLPNAAYTLYVFGGAVTAPNRVNQVTITSGSAAVHFTQMIADASTPFSDPGDLWVNGSLGSNAPLSAFGVTVNATNSGSIIIDIIAGDPTIGVGVAALALEQVTLQALPEPASLALLGLGLAGLGWSRRKK